MPRVFFKLMEETEKLCSSAAQEIKKDPEFSRSKIFHGRKPRDIIFSLRYLGKCARRYRGQRFKNMPLRQALNDKLLSDLWTLADAALLIASISGNTALGHLNNYHLGVSEKNIVPSSVTKARKTFEQSLRCIAIAEKLLVKRCEIYRLLPKQKK